MIPARLSTIFLLALLLLAHHATAEDVKVLTQPKHYPIVVKQSGTYRLPCNMDQTRIDNYRLVSAQANNVFLEMNGFHVPVPKGWDMWIPEGDGFSIVNAGYWPVEGGFVPPGGSMTTVATRPRLESIDDDSTLADIARHDKVIYRRKRVKGKPARLTAVDRDLRTSLEIVHLGNNLLLLTLWSMPDDPEATAYDRALWTVAEGLSAVKSSAPTCREWVPTPTPPPRDPHRCSCDPVDCEGGASACSIVCGDGEEAVCECSWCRRSLDGESDQMGGGNTCSCEKATEP